MSHNSPKTGKPRKTIIESIGGLELKAPDPKDFSFNGVFGAIDVALIPLEDWLTGHFFMKNQKSTDLCTGMGLAAVKEDQEGVELSAEYAFAQIKKLRGDPAAWGGDLNSGTKVGRKIGLIKKSDAPYSVMNRARDFLAVAANWPAKLLDLAKEHRSESSFRINEEGYQDLFDAIRGALYLNRGEMRSIYTGCIWRPGWTFSEGGVIPNEAIGGGVGHCFKICNGQKIINGQPHLIIQNSSGDQVGDNGFFYMSREVANRELTYGCYMFKDMPRNVAENLHGQSVVQKNKNIFIKLWELIKEHLNL